MTGDAQEKTAEREELAGVLELHSTLIARTEKALRNIYRIPEFKVVKISDDGRIEEQFARGWGRGYYNSSSPDPNLPAESGFLDPSSEFKVLEQRPSFSLEWELSLLGETIVKVRSNKIDDAFGDCFRHALEVYGLGRRYLDKGGQR